MVFVRARHGLAGLAILVNATGAAAQTALPVLTTETVSTFLGINLPLRPGERVVPIGDGDCSVVVFAPDPTDLDYQTNYWKARNWSGACRFGLAHGEGGVGEQNSDWMDEAHFIYGTSFELPRRDHDPADFGQSGSNQSFGAFYRGTELASLKTEYFYYATGWSLENITSFSQIAESGLHLEMRLAHFFMDGSGRHRANETWLMNLGKLCGRTLPATMLGVSKAMATLCADKSGNRIAIVRREGFASAPADEMVVSLVAPCKQYLDGKQGCRYQFEKAVGTLAADFNAALAGDRAARTAMAQEIMDRYAPLEKAFAERLATMNRQQGGQ